MEAQSLSVRVAAGLVGEADIEGEDVDLATTWAVDATYSWRLHPHFALGGSVGIWWWTENDQGSAEGRGRIMEVSLRPEGRLDFGRVGLFGAGQVGPSLGTRPDGSLYSDDLGYHLGLELGARVAVAAKGGLELGLGVVRHQFRHDYSFTIDRVDPLDVGLTQVLLRVGGYYSP